VFWGSDGENQIHFGGGIAEIQWLIGGPNFSTPHGNYNAAHNAAAIATTAIAAFNAVMEHEQ
jgi:hypothetical protein